MPLDPTINAALVQVLAWALVGAVALISSLMAWFLMRTIAQLDRIEVAQRDDTKALDSKIDALQSLVTSEMHKMDMRVARMEEWRKARELIEQGGRP